ncbi:MAG: hypothetical protein FWE40_02585 [Oscillospiraceae bacterium]|jgi:stage III sporulation protein AG|nr:hypothetical protein [Oscillospiraceae bacterium]
MEKVDTMLKKWKISRWQAALLLAGVLGLLLLAVSGLPFGGSRAPANVNPASESIRVDLADFEQQLENRLEKLLGSIAGAGDVRVMLTIDAGNQPMFATQGSSDTRIVQDGDRIEEHINVRTEYVVIGQGAGQQGLVLRMIEPQVRGVAVIAQGGGDILVRQAIVEAVTAVLGIGSNMVSVAQMSG